jgi:hypothetical protein
MEVASDTQSFHKLLQYTDAAYVGLKVTEVVDENSTVLRATKRQRTLFDFFTITFIKHL